MFKILGNIWSNFWGVISWIRTAFFNLLFLLIVVAIVVSIAQSPSTHVPDKIALNVAPEGFLVDQRTYEATPADLLMGSNDAVAETSVRELVETIKHAASDDRITSMVLNLTKFAGGGVSKMEEVGQALQTFKESGKPIYAYGDNLSQQQYFLASFADTIYLNEMGNVLLTGFGMYQNYFKDAADKLSVKFHVFRVGDYKDAVEPYMRNDMSDQSREHNARWINDLWQHYEERVTRNRGLDANAINDFIALSTQKPQHNQETLAAQAKQAGLVDELVSRTEVRKLLAEKVGASEDGDTYDAINYPDYHKAITSLLPDDKKTIGLIVAQGTIVGGDQPNGAIGSASFTDLIRRARDDKSLSAIVIRINSGGGSAFASELIRQEILETRASGKPVYISMGSVAASGGYWLSTAADEIWAQPTTITGSIGVWGLIPNVAESFTRLGVHSDGVGTTPLADIFHPDRTLSQPAQNLIQSGVNDVYHKFINIVAEARESDPESVNEIAGGRVWTGSTAKTLGLVDNLGTLQDTFEAVATKLSLQDYQIKEIKRPLTTSEEIIRALMEEVKLGELATNLSGLHQSLNQLGAAMALPLQQLGGILEAVNWSPAEGQQPEVLAFCLACYAP